VSFDKKEQKQVETEPATVGKIMSHPRFEAGLSDVRNGKPFDWRINCWEYERGRLFGFIAPTDMALKINGKLNPKAVKLCEAAFNRRFIV
jgi:hypothetical protein